MISQETALRYTQKYLEDKQRDFSDLRVLDEIREEELKYGYRAGEVVDVYVAGYYSDDYELYFIDIDAKTGEILYTWASPAIWLEAHD